MSAYRHGLAAIAAADIELSLAIDILGDEETMPASAGYLALRQARELLRRAATHYGLATVNGRLQRGPVPA